MSRHYTFPLIAPSGYPENQSAAQRAVNRLVSEQHIVQNPEIITRRYQRFSGTDAQRLDDINQLASLPVLPDIALAVRGGYGASRLLSCIDYAGLGKRLKDQPVVICGHSDFTAIQLALLATQQLTTFSGQMLAGNFGATRYSDFTMQHFWGLITAPEYQLNWQDTSSASGCWQGTLWGGNLAMLTSLAGTPWMPQIENGILVIEDINEQPFRVERLLMQLFNAGILSRQQAIITGSFTQSAANEDDDGYSLDSVWTYLRHLTGLPVITRLDFGHQADTVTLPLGGQAVLTASCVRRSLRLSNYPYLS